MLVTGFDTLSVMRLTDDRGMTIIELVWKSAVTATNSEASDEEGTKDCESDKGTDRWVIREIPPDKEIIGLYCNTSGDVRYIKSLGFVLWTPNKKRN